MQTSNTKFNATVWFLNTWGSPPREGKTDSAVQPWSPSHNTPHMQLPNMPPAANEHVLPWERVGKAGQAHGPCGLDCRSCHTHNESYLASGHTPIGHAAVPSGREAVTVTRRKGMGGGGGGLSHHFTLHEELLTNDCSLQP